MAEEKVTIKRNKPKFLRVGWHKMIKLGSTVKKKRKWRRGIGRHNKIRLGRAGRARRPKIGWSAKAETRGLIDNLEAIRISNLAELKNIQKGQGVIVAKVGKKKREEILKEAKKMKITILNKYQKDKK